MINLRKCQLIVKQDLYKSFGGPEIGVLFFFSLNKPGIQGFIKLSIMCYFQQFSLQSFSGLQDVSKLHDRLMTSCYLQPFNLISNHTLFLCHSYCPKFYSLWCAHKQFQIIFMTVN